LILISTQSRPDTTAVPSKALFEPPKNVNRLVFQEVRKEPSDLRESTPDLIPQKLDYSNPASSINFAQVRKSFLKVLL